MNGNGVIEANDLTWEQTVEKSTIPVIVMFYTPTCPHCRTMEPYFREFSGEFAGKVVFARINLAESAWIGERYGVMSTPTFKFFCGGKPVQDLVGAVYPAILKKRIEEVLVHGKECAEKSTEIDYEISGYA
ncbi:thioredoxin [Methanomicrobiaceae archaeon CYW5]|uniref:thioredoxin family protein n=1 Tax=Methanovulcanius yangii TaxID=1789227 RepID=UPI0029CA5B22|nr:thioredoxin family protein [Methanovulcanius yangii]MBT8508530.1 thioredoxin [Methanovulcanius yangii]